MSRFALVLVAVVAVFGAMSAPSAHALSPLLSFGEFGLGPGQFDHPLGVSVADDGNVWVVDALNDRVQEWTAAAGFVRAFGSTGTGRGQFRLPEDVEARGGYVYVSDCYGQRVQRFAAGSRAPAGEFTGGAPRRK
ncbi:MAG: 6-bladed beta-propeller, partial [Baekduiaceae bacterium]